MSGYKDFVAGDPLTAAQVDGYLMRQSVMVFASASARDAALSGVLVEGMHAYLTDAPNRVTYYTGSAWVTVWSDWTSFTPSWAAGVTVGNGTYNVARWKYIAPETVRLEVTFLLGSTSAITGNVQLTTPITMNNGRGSTGLNVILSNSGTDYPGMANATNGTTTDIQAVNTGSDYAVNSSCSATIPFTWGTGDRIVIYGVITE
jgi:hypothetical protein